MYQRFLGCTPKAVPLKGFPNIPLILPLYEPVSSLRPLQGIPKPRGTTLGGTVRVGMGFLHGTSMQAQDVSKEASRFNRHSRHGFRVCGTARGSPAWVESRVSTTGCNMVFILG